MAALAREAALFGTLVDFLPDAIYAKDTAGRFTYVNRAAARQFGQLLPKAILGKTDFDFFPEDLAATYRADEEAIFETGQAIRDLEEPSVDAFGQRSWHLTTKLPLRDHDGNVVGLVGVTRDITERKRAEEALENERNLFLALIEHVPDYIYVKDAESRFVLTSHAAARSMGQQAPEGLVGKSDFDFHPPEMAALYHADEQKIFETGQPLIDHEERVFDQKGDRWYLTTKVPFRDRAGRIVGLVGIGRDVTERKRGEEELRNERNLYRTLVDNLPDYIYAKDNQSRFIFANVGLARVMGAASPEDLVGKTDFDFYPRELAQYYFDVEQELFRTGQGIRDLEQPGEHQLTGEKIWHSTTKVPLRDSQGSIIGLVGIGHDITRRKRAEEELREYMDLLEDQVAARTAELIEANERLQREIAERRRAEGIVRVSEERYRALYEDTPSMYLTVDPTGTVLSVNEFGARQLGYAPEALLGQPVAMIVGPDDREAAASYIAECLAHPGQLVYRELRKVRKDGSLLDVKETARAVPGPDGDLVVLIVSEDITERKEVEKALERRDAILAAVGVVAERLLQASSLGEAVASVLEPIGLATDASRVFVYEHRLDESGEPIFARRYRWVAPGIPTLDDRAVLKAFRYRELGFERWAETLRRGGVIVGRLRELPQTEQAELGEHGVKSILILPVEVAGGWWGYMGIEDCLVERVWSDPEIEALRAAVGILGETIARKRAEEVQVRLEAELRQAQKMEAVGRLAGGVAHDFNNLLTAITGYSELMLAGLELDDPQRRDAEEIRKASERASSLTRQLMAFARRQPINPVSVDLNEVVSDMDRLLRRLIGEDVELVTVLDATLAPVLADRGQLEQVIVNLAVNARDAMPDGGKLVIETANVDAAAVGEPLEGSAGAFASVAVTDTGAGMDEATRSHIFEPFFTTKERGKGTGLGLATLYGIVEQHDGRVIVSSAPGQGTTFRIYLPAAAPARSMTTPIASPRPDRGSETILLVEDEELIRTLAARVLREQGYTVLAARYGDEALAIAADHQHEIALALTDVVMPGMSGFEVAERLRSEHPELRLIFMSGYTDPAVTRHGAVPEGAGFIGKPFTPVALLRKVRDVLDQANGC